MATRAVNTRKQTPADWRVGLRRSIRRYQEARNLQKTGYLNQRTVVRLLADSVLR